MIPQVRKISSTPLTHRKETLDSIARKAHHINARIESLRHDADKMKKMLDEVPEDAGSRLDWLNKKLMDN